MKKIVSLVISVVAYLPILAGPHWSLPVTGRIEDQMELFFPDSAARTGQAVLVLPGGGYHDLSYNEKELTCRWLQAHGVMAVALSYRMPEGHAMWPIEDAWEAMRYIRAHAEQWHIDRHQIGVMGFSAGGHLAATLSVHNDSLTRPDFSILFYPVISMRPYRGSRERLLGLEPTEEQMAYFSCEEHVNALTPPTLFLMSAADGTVPPALSCQYVQNLLAHRVYTEAMFFPEGKHGFCFKQEFPYHGEMIMLLERFLYAMKEGVSNRYMHRVGTWNIRVATEKDKGPKSWSERRQWVAELIRRESLDIVGLQEIKTTAQLNDLRDLLPEYTFVAWGRESADTDTIGERLAVAYRTERYSISKTEHFFLSETPEESMLGWDAKYKRLCLWVQLTDKQTKQSLRFAVTHLDNEGRKARQQGAALVTKRIAERSKYMPTILAGDMNTKGDDSVVLREFAPFLGDSRILSQTAPKGCLGTWSGWNPADSKARLDYLLVHDVEVLDYETVQEAFGRNVTPSDHFPVVLTIRF